MADSDAIKPERSGGGSLPFSPHEFQIALRYLKAKRKHGGVAMIAMISFIGIALAVTGLIAVMSIMNGFRTQLFDQLLGSQPHVYVDTRLLDQEDVFRLVDEIEAIPGVKTAGPVIQGQVLAQSERYQAYVQVMSVRPSDLARLDIVLEGDRAGSRTGITHGSLEYFGDGRNGGNGIVLGAGLAVQLGVNVDDRVTFLTTAMRTTPTGRIPTQKAYYVDAIIASGISTIDDTLAFMPLEQGNLFFGRQGVTDLIEIRLDEPTRSSEFVQPIAAIAGPNAAVYDFTGRNPAFFNALQFERMAMRLIMAIVIAIAAMNIVSGLVMLVKNKSRDIAILRTMGTTQASVLRIFLIVGASIGMLGTAAGILLGVLFVWNIDPIQDFLTFVTGTPVWDPSVYYLPRVPAELAWGEVLFVSTFGFAVSLLVTLPPAWRAARLDPVEALRYE